jgi:hypothetical protein
MVIIESNVLDVHEALEKNVHVALERDVHLAFDRDVEKDVHLALVAVPSLASRRSTRRRTIPTRLRLDTMEVTRSCICDAIKCMQRERAREKKRENERDKKRGRERATEREGKKGVPEREYGW